MALYAIGDFHLSIVSERNVGFLRRRKSYEIYKPMDVFDPVWKDHTRLLYKYFNKTVKKDDTTVITGDHSWGLTLEDCAKDLAFIEALPGRKILLRGNHDLFWNAKKTEKLNAQFAGRLFFLQNNFYTYHDYALVGTKGICYEGKGDYSQFEKKRNREIQRLRTSFEAAEKAGFRKYIMFLHFPPTSVGEQESCFTDIAKEYGVSQVIYSHYHGQKHYHDSLEGEVEGICYRLVSSDYLRFHPLKILS